MTGTSPLSTFHLPDFHFPTWTTPDLDVLTSKPETAYKWVDENGITHYANESPENQSAELIKVDPNTNLIRGIDLPESDNKNNENSNTAVAPAPGPLYPPENVQKLIQDAKNIENVLHERQQQQDKIINNQ